MYQPLNAPLTDEERKKIQTRIDELTFVKGLGYNFAYGESTVPVENASLETIYYAFTDYTTVIHSDKPLDIGNSNTTKKNSEIDHSGRDEETPLISTAIQVKHNTLYIQLEKTDNNPAHSARVTYLLNNYEHEESFDLNQNTELKNLEALLPEKGSESRNPTLLRLLGQHINQRHNTSQQNLKTLLLWVKHYDGTYKTISLRPQDLNLKTFTSFDPRSKKDQIIELLSKKGFVNTGIINMDDNQQFMPDTYKPEERKIKFRYYTGSLALEAGFAYLSCISALQGWKTVIKKIPFLPEQLAADLPFTFASIGTGIDFIVNISTISSANCANAYAILQKRLNELEKELSPTMKKLLPIIGFLQESSFYMGGAGNALWVFDVCKPLYSIHPALFYLPTILATAAIAKLGREYYWGFMAERYFESIIAFDKYLKTTSPNNDLYCNCMILLMALSVLLFRSFSFGGISVFLAKGLNPTGYDTPLIRWATFFASLYFTFATAISILFTRIKAIINFWSALQTQKQKNAGWKAVNLLKTLRSSTTAECLTMACGLLYISDFQNNTPTYMLASASALIIYISCMAQIRREICVQATRILTENGIDINTEENNNNTPAQTEQALETPLLAGNNDHLEANQALLSEEDQMFKNIQAVDRIFTSLRSPTQGVRFLVGAIVILCFFSVLTRGLSFLGFMDVLKMVFSAVIEFSAKNKIIIGLGLVLGPPNLKNLFLMFEENFVETTAQKYGVERQIAADNGKIPDSFCGKFGYYLGTLYQTGGWSFTAGQVRTTIDKEIEELGHKLD